MEQDPALAAVRTYGYLRLALAGLVLLLFASVVTEWGATGFSCLQTSVSAYWHTPARAVFVGVLVTMGVCLVALRGNTPGEDIALNFAGMLAPVVAFVPTGDTGSCSSVPIQASDVAPAVANNVQSLFVLGAVAVAIGVWSARRARAAAGAPSGIRRSDLLGLVVAGAGHGRRCRVVLVARDSFVAHGHDFAAVPMFLAIVVAVWLNGRDVDRAVAQGSMPATAATLRPGLPGHLDGDARDARRHRRGDLPVAVGAPRAVGRGRPHPALRGLLARADPRALEPRPAHLLTRRERA